MSDETAVVPSPAPPPDSPHDQHTQDSLQAAQDRLGDVLTQQFGALAEPFMKDLEPALLDWLRVKLKLPVPVMQAVDGVVHVGEDAIAAALEKAAEKVVTGSGGTAQSFGAAVASEIKKVLESLGIKQLPAGT